MLNENSALFVPIRTTEEKLKNLTPENGALYFTTDSKKIFLGTQNKELLAMGGSSNIFYGTKHFELVDLVDPYFELATLEAEELPSVNDLIINYGTEKSNGFYRVIEVFEDTQRVRATLLAVGGGGTGGGSGGGVGGSGSARIEYITEKAITIVQGTAFDLQFRVTAFDAQGEPLVTNGVAKIKVGNYIIDEIQVTPNLEDNAGIISVPISEHLTLGSNQVTVSVEFSDYGINAVAGWTITTVNIKLTWDLSYGPQSYFENSMELSWRIAGNTQCVTKFLLDGQISSVFPDVEVSAINANDRYNITRTYNIKDLSYGSHTLEMWVETTINNKPFYTERIKKEVVFTSNGSGVIITMPFYDTQVTQYTTLQIPFMVYNSNNNSEEEVSLYIDNGEKTTGTYATKQLHYFTYNVANVGQIKVEIRAGSVIKEKALDVIPLDLGDVVEPAGCVYQLAAKNISNNEELKNNNSLEFSENFDWINGGRQVDENGATYIHVKNKDRMIIKHPIFASGLPSLGHYQGKTIKLIFKITNCYDYDAIGMTIGNPTGAPNITVSAQGTSFKFADTSLTTAYYENSYIELDIEAWHQDTTSNEYPDNFVMFWISGVPAAVSVYQTNAGAGFIYNRQDENQYLTIGSDNCDVSLYLIKVYDRQLSEDEHLNNFILDATTPSEIVSRFNRNDILEGTEISWKKLLEKNPNCKVYNYSIPRMTTTKEDPVGDNPKSDKDRCSFEQYGSNNLNVPEYSSKEVVIKVQGTSSVRYGVAAFNIDSKFKINEDNGLVDSNGNFVEGWKVSDTAIPINYACTKVNVASSENANNKWNQEWYNRFQPYRDGHRRRNERTRDCMEFRTGVMFIQDRNPNGYYDTNSQAKYVDCNIFSDDLNYMSEVKKGTETDNYTKVPYKQYAICNMGNSKKNLEVFHDITNPNACCIEILDNQGDDYRMLNPIQESEIESKFTKGPYEFRYPDYKKFDSEIAQKQLQAFRRLVNWFATNNPDRATNTPLTTAVEFAPKKFEGFIPPGFDDLDTITLANEDAFALYTGPHTHDTYEYRMGKMLSECEDYLVMDSIVFHYLFIERHLMVDNVAKNTFWSTEDLLHWDLTKNYDNDTADGINNNGFLTWSYGREIDDPDTFNAPNAVWLRFINGLKPVCNALYKQLSNAKAWEPNSYLNAIQNDQDSIPERCWIYDYFKKYIRPRRLGLDSAGEYLERLDGGKRTLQREQFERYQNDYMDSKHELISSDQIMGRFYGKVRADYEIPIGLYANGYYYVEIGGNRLHLRMERGPENKKSIVIGKLFNVYSEGYKDVEGIETPQGVPTRDLSEEAFAPIFNAWKQMTDEEMEQKRLVIDMNDATVTFEYARNIQSLENLAYLYASEFNLSEARKLRHFIFGSDEENFYNPNIINLSVQNSPMLETFEAQNVGKPEGMNNSLDLTSNKALQTLKINGSTFPGLAITEGGQLNFAKINGVRTLDLRDLIKFNTLEFDEGIENSLEALRIDNCYKLVNNVPTDFSYELLKKVLNSTLNQDNSTRIFETYHINIHKDIKWIITDAADLNLEGNKLIGIKVIDDLNNNYQPLVGINKSESLTGTVYLDVACEANEFEIYSKYKESYPYLTIEYSDKVKLTKAPRVTFRRDASNLNSEIYFTVLSNGSYTMEQLMSASGPAGVAIEKPFKPSDATYDYTWAGDDLSNTTQAAWIIYKENDLNGDSEGKNKDQFNAYIPTESIVCYPIFLSNLRYYKLTLMDSSMSSSETNKIITDYSNLVWKVEDNNGNNVTSSIEINNGVCLIPSTYKVFFPDYYYKENNKENMRYEFKGWIDSVDKATNNLNPNIYTSVVMNGDYTFYTYYKEQNINEVESDTKYFEIYKPTATSENTIRVKPAWKGKLKGKITIPSTINNVQGKIIGDFSGLPGVTHIVILNSSSYTTIDSYAFAGYVNAEDQNQDLTITDIKLSTGITTIKERAFYGLSSLESINLGQTSVTEIGAYAFTSNINLPNMKFNIDSLPETLVTLMSNVFANNSTLTITKLPSLLESIGVGCFQNCENVKVETFGGFPNDQGKYKGKLQTIGAMAFSRTNSNGTILNILPSVVSIGNGAFYDYGKLGFTYYAGQEIEVPEQSMHMLRTINLARVDKPAGLDTEKAGYSNSVDAMFALTTMPADSNELDNMVTDIVRNKFNVSITENLNDINSWSNILN